MNIFFKKNVQNSLVAVEKMEGGKAKHRAILVYNSPPHQVA